MDFKFARKASSVEINRRCAASSRCNILPHFSPCSAQGSLALHSRATIMVQNVLKSLGFRTGMKCQRGQSGNPGISASAEDRTHKGVGLSLVWHFQSGLGHLHQFHARAVQTENNIWEKVFGFFLNSAKINNLNLFPTFWTFPFTQDHTWVLMLLRFLLELSPLPVSWDLMPETVAGTMTKHFCAEQTQPLQVPLESDTFLKLKVVSDFAPPTPGINSGQIMWDMSYGKANLSSATRNK